MKTSRLSTNSILKTIFSHLINVARKDEIYLVGGTVRDLLTGYNPYSITDYDFAIKNSDPLRLVRKLSKKIHNSSPVILDDERRTCRLIVKPRSADKEITFDFSSYRAPTIKKDLLKRDITINAIGINIKDIAPLLIKSKNPISTLNLTQNLIDPANGLNDIKTKTIRFVSETNLREDPVRLIRAFRFSSETGFSIARKTLTSARRLRREILRAPLERIRDELLKILDTTRALKTLHPLEKCGILEIILPEINALKKSCRRFYFHPQGLWHHTTETLSSLEYYTTEIGKNFPESSKDLSNYLDKKISSATRRALLKLIVLFHDSAKPLCLKKIDGRVRFFGHETIGAQIFQKIGQRLKLSRDEITFGSNLIRNHMRILQLVGNKTATERAIYRLKRETGDNFPALCLLSLSDADSYKKLPDFVKNNNIKDLHRFVRREIKKFFDEKKQPKPAKIINGHILMRHLKIPPGPTVGQILKRLEEERALGKIKNTADAIKTAKNLLKKIKRKNISYTN